MQQKAGKLHILAIFFLHAACGEAARFSSQIH
jgi:hypothetical protein